MQGSSRMPVSASGLQLQARGGAVQARAAGSHQMVSARGPDVIIAPSADRQGEGIFISSNAQDHIDAFLDYDALVGEADGGIPMTPIEFEKLKKKAEKSMENRLYASWRNSQGQDCINIGPATRCLCGHSYRAHEWWRNQTKNVQCRVRSCGCKLFQYVPRRGTSTARCGCKHTLEDHVKNGKDIGCIKCQCSGYDPTMTCSCGESACSHQTVYETEKERQASGRSIDPNGSKYDSRRAAAGGLTGMASMLHAEDRKKIGTQPSQLTGRQQGLPAPQSQGDAMAMEIMKRMGLVGSGPEAPSGVSGMYKRLEH